MGLMALPDYNLHTAGVVVGLYDRLELSYAWQGSTPRTVFWRAWRRCSNQVMTR